MATTTLDTVRLRRAAKEPELRRHGARHLAVFGSAARGEDSADSDVDLAVEIEDGHSSSPIRMEEARLLLEDALRRPWISVRSIVSARWSGQNRNNNIS
jgi:uncharacterized protein